MIRFEAPQAVPARVGLMVDERRRAPRIELMGQLHGHSVSLALPVKVAEISLGGMAIETREPFPVGSVHVFRLTLGDDSTTDLVGRVMHCRDVSTPGSDPAFRTGIQFVDDDQVETEAAVTDIIDRVT